MNQQKSLQQVKQHLVAGQPEEAMQLLALLLDKYPNHYSVFELLGHCYMARGDTSSAITYFTRAHKLLPKSVNALANLAGAYYENDDLRQAERYFRETLKLAPQHSQIWHFLSLTLARLGNYAEAEYCRIQAENTDPFRAQIVRANSLLRSGQSSAAKSICLQILKQHKCHPAALLLLASKQVQEKQLEEALGDLRKALAYSPYQPDLLNMLSQISAQLRYYLEALDASERLTKLTPDSAHVWQLHANNQLEAGNFKGANQSLETASKLSDDKPSIELQRADLLKITGDRQQAEKAYTACLAFSHTKGSAAWSLSQLTDFAFSPAQVDELRAMQLDTSISQEQACQAAFALARHIEQNKDYDTAFRLYRSANMNKPGIQFSPEKYAQTSAAIKKGFCAELFRHMPAANNTNQPTPIFIVGLPRSGSTLIEQILASHSQVEATMELKIMPALARKVFIDSRDQNSDENGRLDKVSAQDWTAYGDWYLQQTQIYRTNKPYFIDKLPPNFQHIGLIKLALPHSIVIDARRHPMACGLGIYRQYFAHGHEFSYDLQHIGFYYNQYLDLMDYWQALFDSQVLCVSHEKMVMDTQAQIVRLLSHCNLIVEESCFAAHKHTRSIRTASSEQVRLPINQDGLLLWKRYEEQLSALKNALGESTLARFAQVQV